MKPQAAVVVKDMYLGAARVSLAVVVGRDQLILMSNDYEGGISGLTKDENSMYARYLSNY